MRLNLEVDTTRRAIEPFPARSSESAPGGALPDPEGAAEISPVSARTRWLRGATLPRGSGWAFAVCLALILALTYCSRLGLGLWEDGYFVKRFAYNYWHHGTFSWNVVDGPVYGMTSQTLQWLGTVLYVLAPDYVVSSIKAACCAALFATPWEDAMDVLFQGLIGLAGGTAVGGLMPEMEPPSVSRSGRRRVRASRRWRAVGRQVVLSCPRAASIMTGSPGGRGARRRR